jgi:hypothetical protein
VRENGQIPASKTQAALFDGLARGTRDTTDPLYLHLCG